MTIPRSDATAESRQGLRYEARLLEALGEAVVAVNAEGCVEYWNGAAEELFGWAREEVLGRELRNLTQIASVVADLDETLRSALSGNKVQAEHTAQRNDGTLLTARITANPVAEADGVITGAVGICSDVTELRRVRTERERLIHDLELERDGLAALFEEAPSIIALYRGPDHVIEMANARFRELLEGRPLVGRSARTAIPELEQSGILAMLDRVYATGEASAGVEMVLQVGSTADPRGTRYFDYLCRPVHDPDGRVEGIFVQAVEVTRQVTARHDAESLAEQRLVEQARLAAAESHYRRLVENSPFAIFALDAEGSFCELNPAAIELLGHQSEQLMGRSIDEVVAKESRPHAWESVARLREHGGTEDLELSIVCRSGDRRLLHVRSTAVLEDGTFTGVQGVARDITGERAREQQVHLLAQALEQFEEAVGIFDADGRFEFTNSAHARLYGYPPGEASTISALDIFPTGKDSLRFEDALARIRNEGSWAGQTRRRRLDGSEIPVAAIMGRMTDGGRELFIAVTRDISEDQRRQQHLARVERLSSLGTLVSGIAHELNNPLHAISNLAQILLLEPNASEDREALEIMVRESDRAAQIVRDLRSIARQTRDTDTERDLLDLNEVVRQVVKLRRYSLQTSNIQVDEQLLPELPLVWGSRPQIEQAVLNLVLNAQDALRSSGDGGRLSLRTTSSHGQIFLHVRDDGPGIPEEIFPRIFDPFFTTKDPGDGTGLGLPLVHTIVTSHGGEVRVASKPGNGTTFIIELPCAPDRLPQAESAPAIPPPGRSLSILIVDDEAGVRRSLEMFLTRRGHRVRTAVDGEDALRLLEASARTPFDLVLSDLRMPVLGGEPLLVRIRALDRPPPRIIFMTGDPAAPAIGDLLGAGVAAPLIKPIRLHELVAAVEQE